MDSDSLARGTQGENSIFELETSSEGSSDIWGIQQENAESQHGIQSLAPLSPQPFTSNRQGLAIPPALYMTTSHMIEEAVARQYGAEEVEGDQSTSSSMPDLREMEPSEGQQSFGNENDFSENTQHTYGEQVGEEEPIALRGSWEGETEASTSSYLSDLEICSVHSQQEQQRTGYILEIPFRELDDPPDEGLGEAALQDARSSESF
mmetsp:Transcript_12620/g.18130  ORF Transcript_12620/g.18130 Transcript_12620/m.18130 type:complete len:206 (+) Transcript_12620:2793-3410(+)